MTRDLRDAFHLANLRRAWKALNTNPDAQYKSYFRRIYRAYAISSETNLQDLHSRLVAQTYQPSHATKLYLPKKSGLQRTYTLLSIEDQIVYQALANIVADRLLPKVRHRYYKETFGHLYAGKRSRFFYRDWRMGYRRFSSSIRHVYAQGFVYTASFDLTACYDSIDHSVLSHFLGDLGLRRDFVVWLCDCLRRWTANPAQPPIYQGHGIPQGPLSSGILSEVVLRCFDDSRPKRPLSWRYFRYVDDIRFFAKKERDLREMLIQMDLVSKRLGLFPQSGKVEIHRITNIGDEIRSISHPPEPTALKPVPNQQNVRRRLIQLSPRFRVANDTRFKFVLAVAAPSAPLGDRLVQILKVQPHLYISIFNYFSRYPQIPPRLCHEIIRFLQINNLYPALTAAGLRAVLGRFDPRCNHDLCVFAEQIVKGSGSGRDPELLAAATGILLSAGRLTWLETVRVVTLSPDWWSRAEMLAHVQFKHVGPPSYESLVNKLLADRSDDVGILAAEHLAAYGLHVTIPVRQIGPLAQLALKAMGQIRARRRPLQCAVRSAFSEMLGSHVQSLEWRRLLGHHYTHNISRAVRLRGYSESDATAWVNLLDTFHDDLLDSLFTHEAGGLGTYIRGNLGGIFSGHTCQLYRKYPSAYKAFEEIHGKRLESVLSHSVTRSSGKRTRFIAYGYVEEVRAKLIRAYLEISAKW